jgi:hypothetical protein
MKMMIALQTPDARAKIVRAIVEESQRFRSGDRIELPMPALVASGRKPLSTPIR